MDPEAPKNLVSREAGLLRRFLIGAWISFRWAVVGLAVLLVLLIAARLALPYVLRSAINHRLSQIPGYEGRVRDIHVAAWRGAYELHDVKIVKLRGSSTEPYFSAQAVDFSIAWRELFHGKFVSDITVEEGRMIFIKAATPEASQLEVDRRWQKVITDIFPIDLTYLKIVDGRIHYIDKTARPVVNIYIEHIQALATGLRNRPEEGGGKFPAQLHLTGDSIGGGVITASADADPLADHPTFEMRLQLEHVDLPDLNPFLLSYGGVNVSAGTFKFYMEMAARGGRFEGYGKPFFSRVKFTDLTEGDRPITQRAWQALATGLVALVKNKPRDELATRIPFSGEFGHTDVGVWASITSMLRNGFVRALTPAIEHSVKADAIPLPKAPPAQTVSRS